MKKKFNVLMMCFVFVSFSSFAQLKVNSSGRVGIGMDPDASYNLRLSSAIFVSGSGYPDIIVSYNPDGYGRAIYPSSNYQCKVGTPNNQFAAIYAQNNIVLSCEIGANRSIILTAGNSITFNSGFIIPTGSTLEANVVTNPCQ